ncbi:4Fe-4S binding protein [Parasulfitobacter algicola]|nr:4Fe-4S binding protein [Sulfitobacter algicola]
MHLGTASFAEPSDRAIIAAMIAPPMELGAALNDKGVYQLLNSGGAEAGYVFETEPMAPLPGFSGAAINVLVVLDLNGQFLDAKLIDHNEPIFVSGLGEAPFHKFFEQYRGHSISDSLVVGSPYGSGSDSSALVYLDGVTKATASVRIAHESILAATLQVAREKMGGIAASAPAFPNVEYTENLNWDDLINQGLVTRKTVTNQQIDAEFKGTIWSDDDPEATANPDAPYLDLWLIDIGPPSIARAVLSDDSFDDLQRFLQISGDDEPILVIETARHGLVSEDFVRNTAPDWISAEQGGFPIALRDSDLFVELSDDLPVALQDGAVLILRTDRRLGFDPTTEWTLKVQAVREHGMFHPEIGSVTLNVPHVTDARFFIRPEVVKPAAPWVGAIRGRANDLILLTLFSIAVLLLLGLRLNRLAGQRYFTQIRLGILGFVTVFIGWWGQGQLSIVTPLASLRAALDGGSFAFLLYDPFSLVIWAVTIIGFILWGRALFCGWLCPFGALQEFTSQIGRWMHLPQIEPSETWDKRLKWLKYIILAGLVAIVLVAPDHMDKAAEVEPFKTAITTFFIREWYYVAYAIFWLVLSMVLFKGFCRYVCPLGALMAIGGLLRGRNWIERRAECGSPCQLCKVKCDYGAIAKSGKIQYSECFGCLECVTIHDDPKKCVPLIISDRRETRGVAAK